MEGGFGEEGAERTSSREGDDDGARELWQLGRDGEIR